MKPRGFNSLIIVLLVIALVVAIAAYFYISNKDLYPASANTPNAGKLQQTNMASEGEAATLAEQTVINAKITTLSKECFSEDVIATTTDTITFDITEVHNTTCGGDPDTAPHIATVLVNTLTRKATLQN